MLPKVTDLFDLVACFVLSWFDVYSNIKVKNPAFAQQKKIPNARFKETYLEP